MDFFPNNSLANICTLAFGLIYSGIAASQPGLETPVEETETSSSKRLVESRLAPVSTTVLTASQIKRSGALSIPEALRLVPGLIVRELTNGQFEVSIRGMENAPIRDYVTELSGSNLLIMIDERVVYEYFHGIIFWDTLPVAMQDIEQIEVVRGAVSSLYGPNAVAGVIHIKTRRAAVENALGGELNVTQGSRGTELTHFAAADGSALINWRVSGYFEERDRYQTSYYDYDTESYRSIQSISPGLGIDSFPDPGEAKESRAITLNLSNTPMSLVYYDFTYSHQESLAHRPYLSTLATPFTVNDHRSDAVNLKVNYFNLFTRISHQTGEQSTLGLSQFDYDFANTQMTAEYEYRQPRLILRPGVRFNEISYEGDFIGGKQTLRTQTVMLRGEYSFDRDTRLVASVNADRYNRPDDIYTGFNVGLVHELSEVTAVRGSIQRSNNSAFFLKGFIDLEITPKNQPDTTLIFRSHDELNLATVTTYELGVTHKLSFYDSLNLEIFHSEKSDFSEFVREPPVSSGGQFLVRGTLESLPTEVEQTGITGDYSYTAAAWDFRVFLTLQETRISAQYDNLQSPLSFSNTRDKTTPGWYGGAVINVQPLEKLTLNTSLYVMDEFSTYILTPDLTQQTDTYFLANINANYQVSESVDVSMGVRNLSNRSASQFYFTDEIKPLYLVQINAKLQ